MSIERSLPAQRQTDRHLTETGSVSSGTPARRRVESGRPRACDQGSSPVHVVSEDLFRGALIRERKSADRSNQQFGVLLLNVTGRDGASSATWDEAIGAIGAAKRDTDVVGWFEQHRSLGIILPEIGESDVDAARDVEVRVRRELEGRLDADAAALFAIQLHIHQERPAAAADGVGSVEPLLEKVRPASAAATPYDRFKRGLDLAGSLSLLLVLSPLFLAIALLVKLTSRGPVFFRQQRIGEAARPFTMLKFRSMQSNNNAAVHQDYVTWFIKSSAEAKQSGQANVFKIANDPRVTAIGRLLRRTSLDELPQLWNVVRGEMSLVGPRPPLPYEVEQYKAWHRRRVLEVKPGITGLWQVAGRSRTTFDEMVRLDLRYAKSYSFRTDLMILLATPRAVIGGKGAC